MVVLLVLWFLHRQHAQYTKTIRDFPNKGDKPRSHQAGWKSENFDRLLSKYVVAARSANAIDERRKDFDRVGWGQADSTQLSQASFAGITLILAAAIRKRSSGFLIYRCNGCWKRSSSWTTRSNSDR